MNDVDQLGSFFLGGVVDESFDRTDEPLLYDASDLTTHAVIVGMTGSGKTGLGVALIEEAALDGVPVLVIDPKGDMGNLALSFPDVTGPDLEPWLDPRSAERENIELSVYAEREAEKWRLGRESWGQSSERVRRMRESAAITVYTPGSTAGVPISILSSFEPPSATVVADPEAYAERLSGTAASVLSLVGRDPDPLGRDHLLLGAVLDHSWRQGRALSLADLVRGVQDPPVRQLGVLDIDTVHPGPERMKLAMALNALLASPGFATWTSGVPLRMDSLLYEEDGRPRVAIVTVSHLSDSEREFFLSLLLSEVVSWTRSQTGTTSLRAMVYVDELFGMLPPVSEPPTKRPLLTLLKQARAFGVGLALSTQNPVDLDYKALSNAGTWFVGRLQTERDKLRLLDGLKAASGTVDVSALGDTISSLPKRTFVMRSVHEAAPVTFQTRWVMSYLAGPMSRAQIAALTERSVHDLPSQTGTGQPSRQGAAGGTDSLSGAPLQTAVASSSSPRPVLPRHLPELFAPVTGSGVTAAAAKRYFPFLLGSADVLYQSKTHGVEVERKVARLVEVQPGPTPVEWAAAEEPGFELGALATEPEPGSDFADLPDARLSEGAVKTWRELFERWLRTEGALRLLRDPVAKLVSDPDEAESAFRARCAQAARERRDEEVAKLRAKYASRLATVDKRVMREEQAVAREQQQLQSRAVNVAGSVLGAFLGKGRSLSTAINRASMGAKDYGDVQRAKERLSAAQSEAKDLQDALTAELEVLQARTVHPDQLELETVVIRPTSRDIAVRFFGLAWVPFVQRDGRWRRD